MPNYTYKPPRDTLISLPLNRHPRPVVRTPDTPNTRVDTRHRLRHLAQLLSVRVPQQQRLLQNLQRLLVPHAHGLLAPVDVVAHDDGVLAGARGDGDFDFGVLGGEFGEVGFYEAAAGTLALVRVGGWGLEEAAGKLGTRDEGWGGDGHTSCRGSCPPSHKSESQSSCTAG